MIGLNETDEYAAEVPFTLPLSADPLTGLTGWSPVLGQVKIRLPNANSHVDVALNKIVEKGYGRFAARLTTGQRGVVGTVAIYASVPDAQPYIGSETIGTTGGDINVGGTGLLIGYLPDATNPIFGTPASGDFWSLPGAVARVCYQDSTYQDFPIGDVVNLDYGMYGIPVSALNTVKRGKIYYYLYATGYQRFESYSTVLGVSAATVIVAPPLPPPVVSPIAATATQYRDHVASAIDRLCQFAKQKAT